MSLIVFLLSEGRSRGRQVGLWWIEEFSNQSISYQDHYVEYPRKCFCRDILIGLFASCLIWCRVQLGCQGLSGAGEVFVKQIWINSGIQFSKSRHSDNSESDNAQAGRGDTSHWQISIDTNFNSFLNQIWQKPSFCYYTADTGLQQTNHQVSGLYWAGYLWKTGSSGTSWMMEVGVSGVRSVLYWVNN